MWNETAPAKEFAPLPRGTYLARLETGELFASNRGTRGYKLTFIVNDGEHAGRHIWHDLWLTPKALCYTQRDLAKINITSFEQLEQPVPKGYICAVSVVIHRDDDGTERNRVRSIKVESFNPPAVDPYAPKDKETGGVGQ